MIFESRIRRSTVRVLHTWHTAYASAMRESDPDELIGRIEYAISAIERRYSEWHAHPGSPAELTAIQQCISALKRLMKQEQHRQHGAALQRLEGKSTQLHNVPSSVSRFMGTAFPPERR